MKMLRLLLFFEPAKDVRTKKIFQCFRAFDW